MVDGDLTRKANMLMAKDGEIANYEGNTRDSIFFFLLVLRLLCDPCSSESVVVVR